MVLDPILRKDLMLVKARLERIEADAQATIKRINELLKDQETEG